MPGYIAWVYVYGQAVKAAQADGVFNRWNEEGFRQDYYERFVAGVDNLVQTVEVQKPLVEVLDETGVTEPDADPPAGTGTSYTPAESTSKASRGSSAKV